MGNWVARLGLIDRLLVDHEADERGCCRSCTTGGTGTHAVEAEPQPGGSISRLLGHQWISHIYAMWEHEYRPRLAVALGVALKEVKEPLLGDLRLLRHDVLHCRGVATAEHAGRCTLLRWFSPGDDIVITGRMVYEFVDGFGLAPRLR